MIQGEGARGKEHHEVKNTYQTHSPESLLPALYLVHPAHTIFWTGKALKSWISPEKKIYIELLIHTATT